MDEVEGSAGAGEIVRSPRRWAHQSAAQLWTLERHAVRLASVLFLALITINVIFFGPPWEGSPLRISVLMAYLALSLLLWRGIRIAAIPGILAALVGVLLLSLEIKALWSLIYKELHLVSGVIDIAFTIVLRLLINLTIAVVLVRASLSSHVRADRGG